MNGKIIGVETFYPYGLNDNVRGVGNISKIKDNVVVFTLFNKHKRKFRIRIYNRKRRKYNLGNVNDSIEYYLENYKDCNFCFNIRNLVLSLPRKYMCVI